MGPEIEETEPEDRREPPRPLRCRLGLHSVHEGRCLRCPWRDPAIDREVRTLIRDRDAFERLMQGGSSGEHEARDRLIRALGPDWSLTFVADRNGDELHLEHWSGTFVIKADGGRLRHHLDRE